MTEVPITLPPMPDPLKFSMLLTSIKAEGLDAYTEDQLQAYARAAVLADRAEREKGAEQLKAEKDGAYLERNRLVALLATLYPSGIKRTAIEGWSDDWHGCVYIDFPWGQASWHYHDSQAHLFAHLPPYKGEWDGHTTEQKYAAIEQAARAALERHLKGSDD
jgi:hypothetical protein